MDCFAIRAGLQAGKAARAPPTLRLTVLEVSVVYENPAATAGEMLGFIKQLESRSRFVLIVAAFVIIAVIGWVDYLTGHEISFSVFYLLSVALAVWFVG